MLFMRIYIAPTYDCNINCHKCYSRKYQKDYNNYLTWIKFIDIFKRFRANCNMFSFIGGEPTKWKFLNEGFENKF